MTATKQKAIDLRVLEFSKGMARHIQGTIEAATHSLKEMGRADLGYDLPGLREAFTKWFQEAFRGILGMHAQIEGVDPHTEEYLAKKQSALAESMAKLAGDLVEMMYDSIYGDFEAQR